MMRRNVENNELPVKPSWNEENMTAMEEALYFAETPGFRFVASSGLLAFKLFCTEPIVRFL